MFQIIEGIKQGSAAWIAHRRLHLNASDAPAMLACSAYKTRAELIRELATGISQEFSPAQQAILDSGHRFEALASDLMDELAGQSLYNVVGVNGRFGASYDGLSMMEDLAAEHKRLNAALRQAMVEGCTGADLPKQYRVQMEHQCMVCPTIERVLFVASEWSDDGQLIDARHSWYTPDPALRAEIVAGWAMLEQEVAAYNPAADAPQPKPEAKIHDALPALRIEATGKITASNLTDFRAVVNARISGINTVLETDQQFADADADAKWLRDVSDAMKLANKAVRSSMHTVDEVLNVLEQLDKVATAKAVDLEKRVKAEKDTRKDRIVVDADQALADHVVKLNGELGASYITAPRGVFGPVIKGLRTLESMRDKVQAALAGEMAKATTTQAQLLVNREHLRQVDADWITLFPDFATAGTKSAEDFRAIAALRIGEHKVADEARLQRLRDEERERDARGAAASVAALVPAVGQALRGAATISTSISRLSSAGAAQIDPPAILPNAGDEGTFIALKVVKERISPFSIDQEGLATLGISYRKQGGAVLISEAAFLRLAQRMGEHAANLQAAVPA